MTVPHDEFGPEYIVEVYDAKIKMRGFLVIDNTALGPGKGGIRMTPTVTTEEVFRLARTMTWKNAIAGIPFGGAKAGLVANWKSDEEKMAHVQSFARALKPLIPSKYIAGPDVNSGEKEMRWFAEAVGDWRAATGKPANYCIATGGGEEKSCGLPHELGSTGFGVAHAAKVAAETFGTDIKKATVAIEGFGNVGTFAFKHLEEMGAKIVAVSDSKGNAYLKEGLNYKTAIKTKQEKKSVIYYKDAQKLSDDDFWGLSVDIFVTAALTDAINEKNKGLVRAKIIVEGSNIPMRENIEAELWRKGIFIVPDFIANAGGVISSYAEYAGLNPPAMFKMVEEKIVVATRKVTKESKNQGRNPREVAMEIAKEIVRQKMSRRQTSF